MAVRTKLLQFSRHLMIQTRLCSTDPKISSNRDFNVFTTKENLQDFVKVPHRQITKNILFHEHPNPGTCYELDLENQDLINGALMAVETVSKILSTGEKLSELSDLLTPKCNTAIRNQFVYQKIEEKPHLLIGQISHQYLAIQKWPQNSATKSPFVLFNAISRFSRFLCF